MTEATLTSIPAAEPPAAELEVKKDRLKKKKDKVRSAWISFIGRILAQVIGAAATITLGLMFVQKHQNSALEHEKNLAASALSAVAPDDRSVAVLPMQNFSGERGDDYFADAMTEALIADLAQMPNLRVISRTSSMFYKQAQRPLREIASELGVRWIIEGSVVRSEGRVRVTAQLIDARTDEHLWARTYDRVHGDLLTIQADVAAVIARDVRGALGSSGDE
ncbi:MAG TPA: hypothetical protein VHI99_09625 [Vicinamibacterales bacterium]|jgi:TolB-like protein|nr:hypothetical protein [Vicinamibacterales bacterium]